MIKFFNAFRRYRTPGGNVYTLFNDMAKQPHLLIAGATGSGKSVVLNGIIYNLLHKLPDQVELILIDPKRVELAQYRDTPHCIRYASEPGEMIEALQYAETLTEQRYNQMRRQGVNEFQGGHVYVVIDELAALMTMRDLRKVALPILQRLGMIARAARVHIIACTQTLKADVLPTPLTCNFDSRVALRTATAQQSRMIAGIAGCEAFPSPTIQHEALCYFRIGADLTRYRVPMYSAGQVNGIIDYWTTRRCVA